MWEGQPWLGLSQLGRGQRHLKSSSWSGRLAPVISTSPPGTWLLTSLPHQTGDPQDRGGSVLPEGETWSQPEMGMQCVTKKPL